LRQTVPDATERSRFNPTGSAQTTTILLGLRKQAEYWGSGTCWALRETICGWQWPYRSPWHYGQSPRQSRNGGALSFGASKLAGRKFLAVDSYRFEAGGLAAAY
jgi:hypothetical protein